MAYISTWICSLSLLWTAMSENNTHLSMLQMRVNSHMQSDSEQRQHLIMTEKSLSEAAALAGKWSAKYDVKNFGEYITPVLKKPTGSVPVEISCTGTVNLLWQGSYWFGGTDIFFEPDIVNKFCNKGDLAGKFQFVVPYLGRNTKFYYHAISAEMWLCGKKDDKELQVYHYWVGHGREERGHKEMDHFAAAATFKRTGKLTCEPVPSCKDKIAFHQDDMTTNKLIFSRGIVRFSKVCVEDGHAVDVQISRNVDKAWINIRSDPRERQTGFSIEKASGEGKTMVPNLEVKIGLYKSGTMTPAVVKSGDIVLAPWRVKSTTSFTLLKGGWSSYTVAADNFAFDISESAAGPKFTRKKSRSRWPSIADIKSDLKKDQASEVIQVRLEKSSYIVLGLEGTHVARMYMIPQKLSGDTTTTKNSNLLAEKTGVDSSPLQIRTIPGMSTKKDVATMAEIAGEYSTEFDLKPFEDHFWKKPLDWQSRYYCNGAQITGSGPKALYSDFVIFDPTIVTKYCNTGESAGKFDFFVPRWNSKSYAQGGNPKVRRVYRTDMWVCGMKAGQGKLNIYVYSRFHGKAEKGHKVEDHFYTMATQTRLKEFKCDFPECNKGLYVTQAEEFDMKGKQRPWQKDGGIQEGSLGRIPRGALWIRNACVQGDQVLDVRVTAKDDHIGGSGGMTNSASWGRIIGGRFKQGDYTLGFYKTGTGIPVRLSFTMLFATYLAGPSATLSFKGTYSSYTLHKSPGLKPKKGEKGDVTFSIGGRPTCKYIPLRWPKDGFYKDYTRYTLQVSYEDTSKFNFSFKVNHNADNYFMFTTGVGQPGDTPVENPFKPTLAPTPPPTAPPTDSPTQHSLAPPIEPTSDPGTAVAPSATPPPTVIACCD